MDTQMIERSIMRQAASFPHPVLGLHIDETTREVFIFDAMSADLQTPASAVRYILDGEPIQAGDVIRLRPWHEGDATDVVDEP